MPIRSTRPWGVSLNAWTGIWTTNLKVFAEAPGENGLCSSRRSRVRLMGGGLGLCLQLQPNHLTAMSDEPEDKRRQLSNWPAPTSLTSRRWSGGLRTSSLWALEPPPIPGLRREGSRGVEKGTSILLPQHHRGDRPIPFGDDVERSGIRVVSAEQALAGFQVTFVRLFVLVVEVTPVAALMAMQEQGDMIWVKFQRDHTGGQLDVSPAERAVSGCGNPWRFSPMAVKR